MHNTQLLSTRLMETPQFSEIGSAPRVNRGKVTMVLSCEDGSTDWANAASEDSRVITVRNLNILQDSLRLVSEDALDINVVRVIFDQSVGAEEWLEVISMLPSGFRGDLLFIANEEKAFLSAMGRGDDRVIYKLSGPDVNFYLEVSGIVAPSKPVSYQARQLSLVV